MRIIFPKGIRRKRTMKEKEKIVKEISQSIKTKEGEMKNEKRN